MSLLNQSDPGSIFAAFQEFITAPNWADSRRVLEQHPELLSDQADALLEQLAQAQENPQLRQMVEEHHALLRRCREVGVQLAFAQKTRTDSGHIPSEFQADLRQAQEAQERYQWGAGPQLLNDAVAAWERILQHPNFTTSELRFRLAVLNDAGGTHLLRYRTWGRVTDLNHAMQCWRQAVALTPPDSPDLPGCLSNLGTGLCDRYTRLGDLADLNEAIGLYQRAVALTPANAPDLPGCLNNLGTARRLYRWPNWKAVPCIQTRCRMLVI